jgi:hypothetical protein
LVILVPSLWRGRHVFTAGIDLAIDTVLHPVPTPARHLHSHRGGARRLTNCGGRWNIDLVRPERRRRLAR